MYNEAMSQEIYTIKIAGPAGAGIKSAGQILAKALIKSNYNLYDYSEYPSLVRGGHNTYQVSFSSQKVSFPHYQVDLFFAIAPGHWQQHLDEFTKNTIVFSDEKCDSQKCNFISLPLGQIAQEAGGAMTINTVCLGIASFLYNIDLKIIQDIVVKQYGKYAEINTKALELGFKYAQQNFPKLQQKPKTNKTQKCPSYNDGNEAFGWGFLKGKGDFYAAYPMTPATGTLHFLAAKKEEYKINVVHPEDEIAAANMVVGASFAGARAATGTSGGGFALMVEAISLAGVTETPSVFYLVSRPGPATGLPTWTAQGDLLFAINAGHGEFPKIVLSPSSHQEAFEMGVEALNLAATYQTPVVVLNDKMLAESGANTLDFSKQKPKVEYCAINKTPKSDFKRYSFDTKTGVSPLTLPGTPSGEYLSNSYEHDESGLSTEDPKLTVKMVDKRAKKLKSMLQDIPKPIIYNMKAKKLIIAWGSVASAVIESGLKDYAILQIKTLWPINKDIAKIINAYKEVVVVENNSTSQLTTLLKSQFNFNPTKIIVKYDGRPLFPEEIYEKLK